MMIKGKLIDIPAKRIFPAELTIADKKIFSILELPADDNSAGCFYLSRIH